MPLNAINTGMVDWVLRVTDMPGFKGITGQFDRARFDAEVEVARAPARAS